MKISINIPLPRSHEERHVPFVID